jgi:hypothetical protein
MHDVERHDNVSRHENDNVPMREPLAAEPLPVDEAGLETGQDTARDTRSDETPETTPDRDDTMRETVTTPETVQGNDNELFAGDTVTRLRARWRELQADFVDDPQRAVREADGVVDEVVRTITEHRERLAGEWQGHTDTEHLRLAMREYRTFVDRLLPTT